MRTGQEGPTSGQARDPTTQSTGSRVGCALVTVETGEITGLEAQERGTTEGSNVDISVLTTKISSAKVTGTTAKEVPG